MRYSLLGLALAISAGSLLSGCQEGPGWARHLNGGDSVEAAADPDEVEQTFDPDDASLVVGEVWRDGLSVTVDAAGWGADGALRMDLTVTDAEGLPARISEQHFTFAEDGQALGAEALFEIERARDLDVVLVLDLSQSIEDAGAVEAVREGARALYDALPRQSNVAIIGFSTDVQILARFGSTGSELETVIDTLAPEEGRAGQFTNLWHAVASATELFDDSTDRGRAVVIFTDGRDNVAQSTRDDALAALEAASAKGFAIGLGADVDGSALSTVVGPGRYAATQALGGLAGLFEDVAEHLSERLTLNYITPKRSGQHRLEVVIEDGDASAGFELKFTLDDAG